MRSYINSSILHFLLVESWLTHPAINFNTFLIRKAKTFMFFLEIPSSNLMKWIKISSDILVKADLETRISCSISNWITHHRGILCA